MGLNEWLSRTRQRFETLGPRETLIESAYELYAGSWRVGALLPIPTTNIYEREWDVLVILDRCHEGNSERVPVHRSTRLQMTDGDGEALVHTLARQSTVPST